jgi:superfamily II DNA/RNA helicase
VFESGMAVVPGTRIYYIVDDPKYDLSGSNETVYLVEDGSTYRAGAKGVPVALVKTSSGAHEVVAIPAEYRQNWMAVAAGDRPVRTVVPSRMVSTAVPTMIVVSSDRVYGTNGQPIYFDQRVRDNGRYRMTSANGASSSQRATYHRTHKASSAKSATVKKHHRRTTSATNASSARKKAYRNGYNAGYRAAAAERREPVEHTGVSTMKTAAARYAEEVRSQPDAFQFQNSWYRREAGGWTRSYSWRGPFVYVDKGSVPREVKESEKRGSKLGSTEVIGD